MKVDYNKLIFKYPNFRLIPVKVGLISIAKDCLYCNNEIE